MMRVEDKYRIIFRFIISKIKTGVEFMSDIPKNIKKQSLSKLIRLVTSTYKLYLEDDSKIISITFIGKYCVRFNNEFYLILKNYILFFPTQRLTLSCILSNLTINN